MYVYTRICIVTVYVRKCEKVTRYRSHIQDFQVIHLFSILLRRLAWFAVKESSRLCAFVSKTNTIACNIEYFFF